MAYFDTSRAFSNTLRGPDSPRGVCAPRVRPSGSITIRSSSACGSARSGRTSCLRGPRGRGGGLGRRRRGGGAVVGTGVGRCEVGGVLEWCSAEACGA